MNTRPAAPRINFRLFITIFFCFSILFVGFYLSNVVRISFLRQAGVILMPEEMDFFSRSTNNLGIDILIVLVSVLSMFAAGYLAAVRIKKKGYLVGAIMGASWSLAFALIVTLYFQNGISVANQLGSPEFIRVNFTQEILNAYLATIPVEFFKASLLCGLGGLIFDIKTTFKKREKPKEPEVFRPKSYDELLKKSY